MRAKDGGSSLAYKVDRLVLHQSSPSRSLSSPSHSERSGVELQPKASLGLERPGTARGRAIRTSNTNPGNPETSLKTLDKPVDEEPSLRIRKDREKKEREEDEEEESEREEKSLREQKEKKGERRKADQDVEEEKKQLMREKEKRLCLLQEELSREEEEEERNLKKESEERLR